LNTHIQCFGEVHGSLQKMAKACEGCEALVMWSFGHAEELKGGYLCTPCSATKDALMQI
jgi:hypothetical protein